MDWYPEAEHFEMPGSTLGDHSLVIRIGALTLRLGGLTPLIKEMAEKQYSPFLVNDHSSAFLVTVYPGRPTYLKPPPPFGYLRLEERQLERGSLLVSNDFAAYRNGNTVTLRISRPDDCKSALGAIENNIRWIVADHAINHRGFVIHSAGLVRNGGAYVFFGPSGAGKSTVTGLSEGCPILSDDLVLLRKTQAGWVAATTPFAGTFPQEGKTSGEYPLKGLFRLIQADCDRLSPLPRALAVGKVLSCCPFIGNRAKRQNLLLPLVETCCSEIPAHDLFFRKTPAFWKIILETRNG